MIVKEDKEMKIFKTNLLIKYMEENKLSKSEFCKLSGVPKKVLDMIFRDETDFDIVNLANFSIGLKILRLKQFYFFF